MRKFYTVLMLAIMLLSTTVVVAQRTFTWEPYKTKFTVPDDFRVTTSTGEKWSGTNDDITLSIYPREDEYLSWDEMDAAVYNWAVDNDVTGIGTATELDSDKLNGYWGIMYEGYYDEFPVATMILVDPDYPEITLYIWVSYRVGWEDDVIEILMSFTPN